MGERIRRVGHRVSREAIQRVGALMEDIKQVLQSFENHRVLQPLTNHELGALFRPIARGLAPLLVLVLFLAGLLGRMVRHGKGLALVVIVLIICIIECFQEGFLLVTRVLIHLRLRQVGNS